MLLQFLVWWGRQLSALAPAGIRTVIAGMRPRLVLRLQPVSGAGFAVEALVRRGSASRVLGVFELTEAGIGRLRQATGKPAIGRSGAWRLATLRVADVILELHDGSILERDLTLPAAVQQSLHQALAYEFDHETPFKPDEVYWAADIVARDRQTASVSVQLVMVLKRKLDPLLVLLRQAGISPRCVSDDGLSVRLPRPPSAAGRAWLPAAIIGGAATVILVAAAVPFISQSVALEHATARIAQLQPAAAEVQSLRKQLGDDLREQQRSMGDPLVMLAALTDILPDDTRLVGLSLHDRKLELIGQSSASSLLIGRLANSPGFENPIFSAPVTRPENAAEDTFSINVRFTR